MTAPSLALSAFATPIVMIDLPDLAEVNAELTARLLAEAEAAPSWQRANVGGWHSAPDLSGRPEACYRTDRKSVV